MHAKIRILRSGASRKTRGAFPSSCAGDSVRGIFRRNYPRAKVPDLIVGIDPGANGATAVMTLAGDLWGVARVKGADEDERQQVLAAVFRAVASSGLSSITVIETTFAPRNARGYAAMRLGESRGILIGLAIGSGLRPLGEVGASVWQRDLGALTGGKKIVTRMKAAAWFPDEKITNAEADAILITEWTRRQFAPIETWRK